MRYQSYGKLPLSLLNSEVNFLECSKRVDGSFNLLNVEELDDEIDNIYNMIMNGEASRSDLEDVSTMAILWKAIVRVSRTIPLEEYFDGNLDEKEFNSIPVHNSRFIGAFLSTFEMIYSQIQHSETKDGFLDTFFELFSFISPAKLSESIVQILKDYKNWFSFVYMFNRRNGRSPNSCAEQVSEYLQQRQQTQLSSSNTDHHIRTLLDDDEDDDHEPMGEHSPLLHSLDSSAGHDDDDTSSLMDSFGKNTFPLLSAPSIAPLKPLSMLSLEDDDDNDNHHDKKGEDEEHGALNAESILQSYYNNNNTTAAADPIVIPNPNVNNVDYWQQHLSNSSYLYHGEEDEEDSDADISAYQQYRGMYGNGNNGGAKGDNSQLSIHSMDSHHSSNNNRERKRMTRMKVTKQRIPKPDHNNNNNTNTDSAKPLKGGLKKTNKTTTSKLPVDIKTYSMQTKGYENNEDEDHNNKLNKSVSFADDAAPLISLSTQQNKLIHNKKTNNNESIDEIEEIETLELSHNQHADPPSRRQNTEQKIVSDDEDEEEEEEDVSKGRERSQQISEESELDLSDNEYIAKMKNTNNNANNKQANNNVIKTVLQPRIITAGITVSNNNNNNTKKDWLQNNQEEEQEQDQHPKQTWNNTRTLLSSSSHNNKDERDKDKQIKGKSSLQPSPKKPKLYSTRLSVSSNEDSDEERIMEKENQRISHSSRQPRPIPSMANNSSFTSTLTLTSSLDTPTLRSFSSHNPFSSTTNTTHTMNSNNTNSTGSSDASSKLFANMHDSFASSSALLSPSASSTTFPPSSTVFSPSRSPARYANYHQHLHRNGNNNNDDEDDNNEITASSSLLLRTSTTLTSPVLKISSDPALRISAQSPGRDMSHAHLLHHHHHSPSKQSRKPPAHHSPNRNSNDTAASSSFRHLPANEQQHILNKLKHNIRQQKQSSSSSPHHSSAALSFPFPTLRNSKEEHDTYDDNNNQNEAYWQPVNRNLLSIQQLLPLHSTLIEAVVAHDTIASNNKLSIQPPENSSNNDSLTIPTSHSPMMMSMPALKKTHSVSLRNDIPTNDDEEDDEEEEEEAPLSWQGMSEFALASGIILEGSLQKKSKTWGFWQPRYFVLQESSECFCVLHVYHSCCDSAWGKMPLSWKCTIPVIDIATVIQLSNPTFQGKCLQLHFVPRPKASSNKRTSGLFSSVNSLFGSSTTNKKTSKPQLTRQSLQQQQQPMTPNTARSMSEDPIITNNNNNNAGMMLNQQQEVDDLEEKSNNSDVGSVQSDRNSIQSVNSDHQYGKKILNMTLQADTAELAMIWVHFLNKAIQYAQEEYNLA